MNIISVNKYFWKKGGSEAVFFGEKELLERNGCNVIPFAMQSEKNEESEFSKYFVDEVDYEKTGLANRISAASKIIYNFNAYSKMRMLLQDHFPDLAHFHIFQHQISPSIFGPLRDKNIPIILTLHDLKPICPSYKNYVNGSVCDACEGRKFYNCFKNRCTKGSTLGSFVNTVEMYFHYAMEYYQSVDRYIAPSRFYKQKMMDSGFPDEQISYLPNYIDVSDWKTYDSRGDYILYFGRLSEEKGIKTFLRAAGYNRNIPHLIVGAGPMEWELRNYVVDEKLKNVDFLGFKSGNELRSLIARARTVVVPSEWYENCPMSILEAFAAGRPVIGAGIGGIPELIDAGRDGFIFTPMDAEALAGHILKLWQNPGLARDLGMQGRIKVEEYFSPQRHYEGLMEIYRSVIGESK